MEEDFRPVTMILSGIIGGFVALFVFVVTQSGLKFIIEPIQEQRKIIGEVSYALLVYERQVVRSIDEAEARTNLRELAGKLQSTLWSIPLYSRLESRGWVTEAESVKAAVTALVLWSNHLDNDEKSKRIVAEQQAAIRSKLRIKQSLGALVELGPIGTDGGPSDSP